jgi:hypothetical protein
MLRDKENIVAVAVKDLRLARKLYEGTIGIKVRAEQTGVLLYGNGSSRIRIYESKQARANKGTPASWAGGDEIDGVLQALQSF